MIRDEKILQNKYAFEISYISETGGRPVNEDSVAVSYNNENIVISIADGLGAHGGGDIASKIASDIAEEEYMKICKPNRKDINRIFERIDSEIVDNQTDEIKMKTTLACALCRKKWMYAAHIGDTRIYTFENGKWTYLTADHSFAYDEVKKNHGTLDDIRKNPNRHILKGALGVGRNSSPDVFRKKIKSDLCILICSDGFWEYVNEDEMTDTLNNTSTSHEWLEAMLKCHVKKTDIYNDNYSAICLKIIKL